MKQHKSLVRHEGQPTFELNSSLCCPTDKINFITVADPIWTTTGEIYKCNKNWFHVKKDTIKILTS